MVDMRLEPAQVEIRRRIAPCHLTQGVYEVLLLRLIGFVEEGLCLFSGWHNALHEGTPKALVHRQESANGLLEGIDTRLKALKEEDPDQTTQIDACPLQTRVGLLSLFTLRNIVPEPVPCVCEGICRWCGGLPLAGLAQIAAQLLIQPLVGVLDAILNRFERSR